jgi:hypothetical protein
MRGLLMRGALAVMQPAPPTTGGSSGEVSYSPDWGLFADGKALAQQGLDLLAAIGLVACAGFFIWGAILAAGGTSSQIPHNVARGKLQMFVSTLCALAIGVGALAINTFYGAGSAATGGP